MADVLLERMRAFGSVKEFIRAVSENRSLFEVEYFSDFFFDRFFPYCEYTTEFELSYMIMSTVIAVFREHYTGKHYEIYWRLLRLVKRCEPEPSTAFFRIACEFYRDTFDMMRAEDQAGWLTGMVNATAYPHHLHYQGIKFAIDMKPPSFGFVSFSLNLLSQGIHSSDDIRIICDVLMMPCIKEPYEVIRTLVVMAAIDPVWGRSARQFVVEPMKKFKDHAKLNEFLALFNRRIRQFLYLAEQKKKYRRKSMALESFLVCFKLTDKEDWREELNGYQEDEINLKGFFTRVDERIPVVPRSRKETLADVKARMRKQLRK